MSAIYPIYICVLLLKKINVPNQLQYPPLPGQQVALKKASIAIRAGIEQTKNLHNVRGRRQRKELVSLQCQLDEE